MKSKTWKAAMTIACALTLAIALPAGVGAQQFGTGQSPPQGGISALSLDDMILGKAVKTYDGQIAGEIDDVIFGNRGQISHYLVDVGQGPGEKTVALNPDQLRFPAQDYALFNGTTADLMNIPEVNPYDYGVYGYYGPYAGPYGYRPYERPGEPYFDPYRDRYMSGQGPGWQYPGRGYYGRGQMGMWRNPEARQGQMREYMARGISGETFLSAQVFTPRHENVGWIDDLLVDPGTGRITQAVIGMGDRKVLVPLNLLRYVGPSSVVYQGSRWRLEQMPEYQGALTWNWQEPKAGGMGKQGAMQQSGGGQAQQGR